MKILKNFKNILQGASFLIIAGALIFMLTSFIKFAKLHFVPASPVVRNDETFGDMLVKMPAKTPFFTHLSTNQS